MEQQATHNNSNGDSSRRDATTTQQQILKEPLILPTEEISSAKRTSYLENLAKGREVLRGKRDRDRRNMDHLNSLIESRQLIINPIVSSTARNTTSHQSPDHASSSTTQRVDGTLTTDYPHDLDDGDLAQDAEELEERATKRVKYNNNNNEPTSGRRRGGGGEPPSKWSKIKNFTLSTASYLAASIATGYLIGALTLPPKKLDGVDDHTKSIGQPSGIAGHMHRAHAIFQRV